MNKKGYSHILATNFSVRFMALLKSSKYIEHPLIFEEPIDRKNDTFQFNFFHLLSVRTGVKSLPKQSFQYRENRLSHISMAIDFDVKRTRHDLPVFTRNIRSMPIADWNH
jgi:hypothetical protein